MTFEPQNNWISDHPAYKLEITVNGDRGTLHFECHYVDLKTGEVVSVTAADLDVARIDGSVADHEHGRRNDHPGSLRSWPRSMSRGSLPRSGDCEPGRSARPRRRPPAGHGSNEAADRVRRHVPAAGRGRTARSDRARAIERSRREPRSAPASGPPRMANSSATRSMFRSSSPRTREPTSASSGTRRTARASSWSTSSRRARPSGRIGDRSGSTGVHAASGEPGRP